MAGYNSVNKLPSSWNKRQSRTTKNICCSFKWQIWWSTSSRKYGTKEALGHDASDPDGLHQEMWQAVTDGDWEKKRKMNHHLINAVGRPSFKSSIHRNKMRATNGNNWGRIQSAWDPIRMWSPDVDPRSSPKFPPTSWLRLETWQQSPHSCNPGSVTDERSRVTARPLQALHTNPNNQ